jgi:hypothetical protein
VTEGVQVENFKKSEQPAFQKWTSNSRHPGGTLPPHQRDRVGPPRSGSKQADAGPLRLE